MLKLLKKKPEAAGGAGAGLPPELPPWHPNFRNFERLPDTKVVRTAFFVNGATIVLALVSVLWFAYQEYGLYDLRRQTDQWQNQISRDKRASDAAIGLFKKFQNEAARVADVDAFSKARPGVAELLLNLGRTLPNNIALDTLDLHDNALQMTGTIRGAPDLASGYATAYVESLRADEYFAARFEDIAMLNLTRNPQTGRLSLELMFKVKGADKAAKKP